jgi:hypothetical protein
MSEKVNDGGSAFPQHQFEPYGGGGCWTNTGGMTLRDWFAGQCIPAMSETNPHLPGDRADGWPDPASLAARRARWAYLQADAMIAARGDAP